MSRSTPSSARSAPSPTSPCTSSARSAATARTRSRARAPAPCARCCCRSRSPAADVPPAAAHDRLLASAERALASAAGDAFAARLDLLEGAAAAFGDFSLLAYRETDRYARALDPERAASAGAEIARAISRTAVPPALALASLARPPLGAIEQRRRGAYYTDWRLARYLARALQSPLGRGAKVLDAAAGSGMLLAAVGVEQFAAGPDRDRFVAEQAHA